jgi:nicotinamidase-related amidase
LRNPRLLDRQRTALVVIDVQERYRTVLYGWDRVTAACDLLLRAALLLKVPVLVTEQYPQGLGRTAEELSRHFVRGVHLIEKRSLSCIGAPAFVDALSATGRQQVLVSGIETHACVNQTVHDLLAAGYQVHVPEDATSSRLARDVAPAWAKMLAAGMLPTTSEQSLLELVETADAPEFRTLQSMLKDTKRWQ